MKYLWALVLMITACASAPHKLGGASDEPQIEKLSNGVELITVKDTAIPVVHLAMISKQGSSADPMALSGLTELTINTWLENSEVYEKLAALGGTHSHDLQHDFYVVGGASLSESGQEYIGHFFNLLTKPKLTQKTFDIKKQQAMAVAKKVSDDADYLADIAFRKYIFGAHPYGRMPYGNEDDLAKITLEKVKAKYSKILAPDQIIFLIAGDFDDRFKAEVVKKILEFKPALVTSVHRPYPPQIKGVQILLVDKPDVTQAQIVMGQFSVNKKDPDYTKLDVAAQILGGSFSSRLTQKIRVAKGFTYDIRSDLETDLFEGVLKISTSTKNENVAAVIEETIASLGELVDKGVTPEEVEMAQNYLQARLLRDVEAPDSHVIWIASQRFYDQKSLSVKDAIGEIKDVSASQINKAMKKNFHPQNLKIVVVAPAKKVLKSLQKIGIVEVKHASDY